MFRSLSPQFLYYALLYVLTFSLRAIKAYKARPPEVADRSQLKYRAKYLFFGFELVNVSAGVFILLSESARSYMAAIMILYVILVVYSFFLENDNVDLKPKLAGHIIVTLVVLSVTFYAFLGHAPLQPASAEVCVDVAPQKWRVALPYIDYSLNRNFAVKSEPIVTSYVVEVQGLTRQEAIQNAREKLYSESGPKPFLGKQEKNEMSVIVVERNIVAEVRPESPKKD